MENLTTFTGLVGTTPRHIVTTDAQRITSFRLASSEIVYNESTRRWVPGHMNWFSVIATGDLAANTVESIKKGDRVIVIGQLIIREWENGARSGAAVEIKAATIGHDLKSGTSHYTRSPQSAHIG